MIIFLGNTISCNAQDFDWVKSYGGTGPENKPLCLQIKDGSYHTWIGFKNTALGSYLHHQTNGSIACVGKLSKLGKPLWLWTSDSINGTINFRSIAYDSISENIYISTF